MNSSQNCSVTKNGIHFVQKFLTNYGIGNTPNNEKMPNNRLLSPQTIQVLCFLLNLKVIKRRKFKPPFPGNSSDVSRSHGHACEMILQHMQKE